MSLSNPPTTPNIQSNRSYINVTPTPDSIIHHSNRVNTKKLIHTHNQSTDHPFYPAPPANMSRLQPQPHSQQHTFTSGSHQHQYKGLKPLGMSSSSTLNIPPPPQSPITHVNGYHKSPITPSSSSMQSTKSDRRRSMIIPPSTPTIVDEEESSSSGEQTETLSKNKLKRLSLCARPSSLELDRNPDNNQASSSPPLLSSSPIPNDIPSQPSTPISGHGNTHTNARRPERKMGLRASISYSPAIPITTPRTAERKVFGHGDGWGMDEEVNTYEEAFDTRKSKAESHYGNESDNDGENENSHNSTRPHLEHRDRSRLGAGGGGVQTLAEKHADLLTHIAQRERRVAELKQELLTQENSLAQLKSQWTTIVSRSALSPTPPLPPSVPRPSSRSTTPGLSQHPLTSKRRPTSMISTSTSTSSTASSLSLATIDEPLISTSNLSLTPSTLISSTGALSNTGAAVLSGIISQTEGYLSPEVVQGGKKFFGQLWKTVGAAAGGTVPDQIQNQEPVIRQSYDDDQLDGQAGSVPTRIGELGDWKEIGSKLDLANLQKLITPWDTNSNCQASSQNTNSFPSNSATYPSTDLRQNRNKDRRTTDRSNTATSTSFSSRRIPTSPPATVGLGFDLDIKPSSSIIARESHDVSSGRSNLLDNDNDNGDSHRTRTSSKTHEEGDIIELSFEDNIGDLGKALTPIKKPKLPTQQTLIPSTSSNKDEGDGDGWGW